MAMRTSISLGGHDYLLGRLLFDHLINLGCNAFDVRGRLTCRGRVFIRFEVGLAFLTDRFWIPWPDACSSPGTRHDLRSKTLLDGLQKYDGHDARGLQVGENGRNIFL